jgi:hypothetical protein
MRKVIIVAALVGVLGMHNPRSINVVGNPHFDPALAWSPKLERYFYDGRRPLPKVWQDRYPYR